MGYSQMASYSCNCNPRQRDKKEWNKVLCEEVSNDNCTKVRKEINSDSRNSEKSQAGKCKREKKNKTKPKKHTKHNKC